MATYSFTLVFDRRAEVAEDELDRLYQAGCDDGTFGMNGGVVVADFDRDASSASQALATAVETVEEVVGRVHHVEPGDIVSTGEIAQRLGRSRESIRLLASGQQGPGTFPIPLSGVTSRVRLWHWQEVLRWFTEEFGMDVDPQLGELSRAIADFNAGPAGRDGPARLTA